MAEISATLVKELREKTGAGMMDCKKALAETAGNIKSAADWLRKKGITTAAKKANRTAAEGLVGVAGTGRSAAIVEINAETDFVARNETFQQFVRTIADLTLTTTGDITTIQALAYPGTERTVAEELTRLVAIIGENMKLRRAQVLSVSDGVVASYIHNAVTPGLGRIGVLVALESTGDKDRLAEVGRQLAMHVAAAAPQFLDTTSVDKATLDRERDILVEQARASGKPEVIVAKILEGQLRKYYEEVVLLEQIYVIDGETRVAKVIETAARAVNASIRVASFSRFVLGEGISHEEGDFSTEIAEVLRR